MVVGALVAENPDVDPEKRRGGTKEAAAPRDFQELELLGPNRVEPRRFMQASLGVEPGEVVAEVAGEGFVRVKLVDIFRHDTRQISEAQRGAVSPELLDGVWRRENHRRGADAQEVGDPATVIVFRMLRQHRPVASH